MPKEQEAKHNKGKTTTEESRGQKPQKPKKTQKPQTRLENKTNTKSFQIKRTGKQRK